MSAAAQPPDAAAFAALMARLDELERINRDLLRENQELKRENQELRAKVIALDAQLRRVVRRA